MKEEDENWTWGTLTSALTGEAVRKIPSHPKIAESKEPSTIRSALNRWSLSFAPSSASKLSICVQSSVALKFVYGYVSAKCEWKDRHNVWADEGERNREHCLDRELFHWQSNHSGAWAWQAMKQWNQMLSCEHSGCLLTFSETLLTASQFDQKGKKNNVKTVLKNYQQWNLASTSSLSRFLVVLLFASVRS